MAQTRQKPNRSLSETQTSPCNDLWAWCWSGVLGDVWGKNNMVVSQSLDESGNIAKRDVGNSKDSRNQMSQAFFVKRNPLHKWNWSNLYLGILFWGRRRDECILEHLSGVECKCWTWRMALPRVLKVNLMQWMPCKENTAQMLFRSHGIDPWETSPSCCFFFLLKSS